MSAKSGSIIRVTRRVVYHEDDLNEVAEQFGGYAAHEIADLAQLKSGTPRLTQTFQRITGEVAFAIRCAVQHLPEEALPTRLYTPSHLRRRADYELLRRLARQA
jgi:hypothetical protein